MAHRLVPRVTGIGSWPGTAPRRANGVVRDLLADDGLPFLVELPARGPGADLVGRTAALLPELSVDLQPSGWRLAGGRGRDSARGAAYLREDLDELAEAYDGFIGELKVSLCGPWTLAASVALPRGEKALSDPGACRDLRQSLGAAAVEHLARVQSLVPGAALVLQWDEPALTAVLDGAVPTDSGFSRLRAVDPQRVREALTEVTQAVAGAVRETVLHTCAAAVPVRLVSDVPDLGIALDTSLLGGQQWEDLAELVEDGRAPWLGLIPTDTAAKDPRGYVDQVTTRWHQLGLRPAMLTDLTISPACGLAGRTPDEAVDVLRLVQSAAQELAEFAQNS